MYKPILAGVILGLIAATSHAALLGRMPITPGGSDYQAYFDTVLNTTWLADANAGAGSPFDDGVITTDGAMHWDAGQAWIGSLNSAGYLGVSNWRMPSMDVNGDAVVVNCIVGTTELACRDNEFGYMATYNHVGQSMPGCPTCGAPFSNVGSSYWSGTEYAGDTSNAWSFYMNLGENVAPGEKAIYVSSIWAVRSGDIGIVPIPAAGWLFGSGVAALRLLGKRRPRSRWWTSPAYMAPATQPFH